MSVIRRQRSWRPGEPAPTPATAPASPGRALRDRRVANTWTGGRIRRRANPAACVLYFSGWFSVRSPRSRRQGFAYSAGGRGSSSRCTQPPLPRPTASARTLPPDTGAVPPGLTTRPRGTDRTTSGTAAAETHPATLGNRASFPEVVEARRRPGSSSQILILLLILPLLCAVDLAVDLDLVLVPACWGGRGLRWGGVVNA